MIKAKITGYFANMEGEMQWLALYRMDLDALVQKNWNSECDLYMNKATQKYFFVFFEVGI